MNAVDREFHLLEIAHDGVHFVAVVAAVLHVDLNHRAVLPGELGHALTDAAVQLANVVEK